MKNCHEITLSNFVVSGRKLVVMIDRYLFSFFFQVIVFYKKMI